MANAFADFFTDKITAIREELHLCRGGPAEPLVEVSYDGPKFECFKQVSCQELSDLLAKSSIKSCALDPIPATVLKGCLDLLLPFITKLVNCSLQWSVMTESMKQAQLRPLLKKPSLNHELFKNYRPISNLMFISKSCEKAVAVQLKDHVRNNNLDELFQSAYKAGHSTETALLRVQNDVLRAIDNGGCVMLLLLDLSAAFDTVDHSILLSRLSNSFGIAGAVYQWFQSYLSGRTQFVAVGNARSSCRHLTCGLPQGSVLGPMLYLIYTTPIGSILRRHNVGYHLYADDTQVYLSFKSTGDFLCERAKVEACLKDINSWMLSNNLKLNNGKTELLVLHSKYRPQPSLDVISVGNTQVSPSDEARNLGAIFDSTMGYERHISEICKSAFYHIRNISHVRRYLNAESTEKLVHALVTSRLDNCNAVLFGLPDYLIKRLQYVLNAAARLVSLINKYDHITPVMMQLHWLPVKERINFKILLTTFKALHGINPLYLCELISPYQPRRALRSSDQLLLEQPAYKLKSYGSRAFSVCAPGLWNKLPLEIKSSTSVPEFKRRLKTHLFRQAFFF